MLGRGTRLPNGSALLHVRAALAGEGSTHSAEDEREVVELLMRAYAADRRLPKKERSLAVQGPLTTAGEGAVLGRIRARLDRAGYKFPSVAVAWRHVSVQRAAVSEADARPSVAGALRRLCRRGSGGGGSGSNGSGGEEGGKEGGGTYTMPLIDATGVLRPRTMTLLLGPPGAGRSTLMKVLSGRLTDGRLVTVDGGRERVTYNGRTRGAFVVARTVAYVDQVDRLLPTLTTRETLNFAETCAGGSNGHIEAALRTMLEWEAAHPDDAPREPLDDEVDRMLVAMLRLDNLLMTEWALHILGLTHAADTFVGDAMLRGVSGGERRRVAVGEGLVTPASVLVLDEASTGLDSASTLALVQSMRRWATMLDTTVLMALLQPEPAVVDLFDDVLLLGDGRTLYHGPARDAPAHFAALGLRALPGQELADFLLQLASPREQRALLQQQRQRQQQQPKVLTPAELSTAWWGSPAGEALRAAAERSALDEADAVALSALDTRRAAVPWRVLLRACAKRLIKVEFQRNWEACAVRWVLALFMAIVTGVLFHRLPVTFSGGLNLLGMIFNALFWLQVLSLASIETTFAKRAILFRQRDDLMVPAWAEWLPSVLLNAPVVAVDVLVYGVPLYWLIGLTPAAAPFFTWLLVLFAFGLVCDNIYRTYGSAAQVLSFAIGVGVCQGLVNEMLAGFVVTPEEMPPWWRWAYWLNPIAYAFRALATNELRQPRWDAPSALNPGERLGDEVLALFQVDARWSWVWGGVGVLLGMAAACALATLAAMAFNSLPETRAVKEQQQQQQEEGQEEEEAAAAAVPAGAVAIELPLQGPGGGSGGGSKGAAAATTAAPPATTMAPPRPTKQQQHQQQGGGGEPAALRGVSVAFVRLCYFVPHPAAGRRNADGVKAPRELQLLHGITGAFVPRRLTALMGSSGAGKTTLLDVIAGRKTAGRIEGVVAVDGRPRGEVAFARLAGYCEQADVHAPRATVREALEFSAALRLPPPSPADEPGPAAPVGERRRRRAQVAARVERVLRLVGLTRHAGRMVGTPGVDGLSTEQRKRLTIAVELVAAPRVLFLDEPTSGLDGRAAQLIVGVMRGVADAGLTVVATIHQPSAALFAKFDELLLLQRGGRVAYNGPLGAEGGAAIVDYVTTHLPDAPRLDKGQSVAAWLLDVIGGPAALDSRTIVDPAEAFAESAAAEAATARAEALATPPPAPGAAGAAAAAGAARDDGLNPAPPAGWLTTAAALTRRNWRAYARFPGALAGRFAVTVAIALIVGSIEWGKGDLSKVKDARGVQNALGGVYMLVLALATEVGFECQAAFAAERPVYYRERAAGAYGPGAYLLAQTAVELAYVTAQVLLYTGIAFPMIFGVGSASAATYGYVLAIVWLTTAATLLTGQALVHVTPAVFVATTFFSLLSNLQGLVTGFTRPLPTAPTAWWPAFFLNPFFYSFVGIGSWVLGGGRARGVTIPDPRGPDEGGGALAEPSRVALPEYVEALFGMSTARFPGPFGSLGMLGLFCCCLLCVSYAGLRWLNFQRR